MKKRILILITASILAITALFPAFVNAAGKNSSPNDIIRVEIVTTMQQNDFNAASAKTASTGGYKLMGVKWQTLPVSYSIDPDNNDGLSSKQVTDAISAGAEEWDEYTSKELFSNDFTVTSAADYGVYDEMNSIDFGYIANSGTIAVTSIWYSKSTRQIYEFDIRFNDSYVWGDSTLKGNSVMDLQNIATHELGHGIGLSDIYNSRYATVTMYGYSFNGDIEKRTLEEPDIAGLRKIYGN